VFFASITCAVVTVTGSNTKKRGSAFFVDPQAQLINIYHNFFFLIQQRAAMHG
jgi:hypothetical protein